MNWIQEAIGLEMLTALGVVAGIAGILIGTRYGKSFFAPNPTVMDHLARFLCIAGVVLIVTVFGLAMNSGIAFKPTFN